MNCTARDWAKEEWANNNDGFNKCWIDSFYVYMFDTPEINTVLLREPVSLISEQDAQT